MASAGTLRPTCWRPCSSPSTPPFSCKSLTPLLPASAPVSASAPAPIPKSVWRAGSDLVGYAPPESRSNEHRSAGPSGNGISPRVSLQGSASGSATVPVSWPSGQAHAATAATAEAAEAAAAAADAAQPQPADAASGAAPSLSRSSAAGGHSSSSSSNRSSGNAGTYSTFSNSNHNALPPLTAAASPASMSHSPSGQTYELVVIQQPTRARSCGFGSRLNRRPVDPCVILQLGRRVLGADGQEVLVFEYDQLGDVSRIALLATLVKADSLQDCSLVVSPQGVPPPAFGPLPTTARSSTSSGSTASQFASWAPGRHVPSPDRQRFDEESGTGHDVQPAAESFFSSHEAFAVPVSAGDARAMDTAASAVPGHIKHEMGSYDSGRGSALPSYGPETSSSSPSTATPPSSTALPGHLLADSSRPHWTDSSQHRHQQHRQEQHHRHPDKAQHQHQHQHQYQYHPYHIHNASTSSPQLHTDQLARQYQPPPQRHQDPCTHQQPQPPTSAAHHNHSTYDSHQQRPPYPTSRSGTSSSSALQPAVLPGSSLPTNAGFTLPDSRSQQHTGHERDRETAGSGRDRDTRRLGSQAHLAKPPLPTSASPASRSAASHLHGSIPTMKTDESGHNGGGADGGSSSLVAAGLRQLAPLATVAEQVYPGPSQCLRTLFGSTIASCERLTDMQGRYGAFFLFPEICLRIEGMFRLQFVAFDLASCMVPQPSPQPYIAMTHSQSFRSYNQRDFPGMQKSPPLMQHFFRQGVRISVRSKTPPRKTL